MTSTQLDAALWALGRGTGVVALVLLTISICLGIVTRSRQRFAGLPQYGLTAIHKTASLTATALIVVHVTTLLLDPKAQLRLVDTVVPFTSTWRPLWLGLGTLGIDLLLLVVTTSLLRKRIGHRTFRLVHWATYLLWPVALAHALGTGTDAGTWWMDALAASCVASVLAMAWWRLGPAFGTPIRTSAADRLQHPEALRTADLGRRVALVGQPARE
ncbi:MAG: iron reductase [Marmoricola sp.]|nr:iron reductase [Marmoricola sp.]